MAQAWAPALAVSPLLMVAASRIARLPSHLLPCWTCLCLSVAIYCWNGAGCSVPRLQVCLLAAVHVSFAMVDSCYLIVVHVVVLWPDHVFAWQLAKVDVACYDTVGRVVAAGDHTDAFPSRVDARFEAQKRYIGLRGGGGARADTIGDLADVLDEVEDQAGGDASAPRKSRRRTRLAPTPLFSRLVSAQGDGTTSVRGSSAVVYSPRWFAVVVPGCPAGCTLRLHMWASNAGCDDPAAPGQALGATAVAHITHASAGGVLAVRSAVLRCRWGCHRCSPRDAVCVSQDPPDMTVSSGAGASSAGHRAASPPLAWSFTS